MIDRISSLSIESPLSVLIALLAVFLINIIFKKPILFRKEIKDEQEVKRDANMTLSLYDDLDTLLAVSYLVQDFALFNNWEKITGFKKPLHEPDFFQKMPRTLTEVNAWYQRHIPIFNEAKTLQKYDPGFDFACLANLVARNNRFNQQFPNGEEPTMELLDDKFAFYGVDSLPVYGISRNPRQKRLVVFFRGSVSSRDWGQDMKAHEREVSLSRDFHISNPNKELLEKLADKVTVHSGFYEYLFETGHREGQNKFDEIMNEVLTRLNDPRNKGYSLLFTGHSLGKEHRKSLLYNFLIWWS